MTTEFRVECSGRRIECVCLGCVRILSHAREIVVFGLVMNQIHRVCAR